MLTRDKNEWSQRQSVQTWYREWPWDILEIWWFWDFRVTVTVKTTAIRRGFELYECLLVAMKTLISLVHGSDWQVLELCVGFCKSADLRAVVCRLITESSADSPSLLKTISHRAVLSTTELTVAVECLHHIYEVSVYELFHIHNCGYYRTLYQK